jgi:hypothetical protein
MNELALFAGAGGGILGGRLLGWRTVCAVEIDPYDIRGTKRCQTVEVLGALLANLHKLLPDQDHVTQLVNRKAIPQAPLNLPQVRRGGWEHPVLSNSTALPVARCAGLTSSSEAANEKRHRKN